MYQAAIFDLDGVLADTANMHFLAWKKLADERDVYFDRQINERLKGQSRMASLDILLERSTTTFTDSEKLDLATTKNSYYQALIGEVGPNELLPGALTVLNACRDRQIKTALASASKNAIKLIDKLGIAPLIDYVADANFIEQHKPHPEIFLAAAAGLGVEASDCVAFEDAAAGVAAINAAGMTAIGIGHEENLKAAYLVFGSLTDFSLSLLG